MEFQIKIQQNFQIILYELIFSVYCFIIFSNNYKNVNALLSTSDFFDDNNIKEDANLLVPELIKKYNYPVEIHHVTTEDGYILELHRIVKKKAEPFLLIHGLIDSSATFILMGPNHALGYFLWDKGYDVWMGNARGNRYSRRHIQLNPDSPEFWNFSWHEIGLYDVPAMIDYILCETKYNKLHYVGHSQGTTSFFVMCSKKPEYNNKILLMHALSPITYLKDIKCPLCFIMDYFLQSKLSLIFHEFLPRYPVADSPLFSNPIVRAFCLQLFYFIMGPNPNEYNKTMFPVFHSHFPAGCSIKQVRHYFQLIHSGNFEEYDYGAICNNEIYKSSNPPKYNLTKITAPIILYFGKNDYLNEPKNVHRLYKEIPNILGVHQIDQDDFSHMDFCWAINARSLVYEKMLRILNDLQNGKLKYVVD